MLLALLAASAVITLSQLKGNRMSRERTTEPKERAAQVRSVITLATTAGACANGMSGCGDDLTVLWGICHNFQKDVLVEVMKMPGIRIAVFPVEEGKEEPK